MRGNENGILKFIFYSVLNSHYNHYGKGEDVSIFFLLSSFLIQICKKSLLCAWLVRIGRKFVNEIWLYILKPLTNGRDRWNEKLQI